MKIKLMTAVAMAAALQLPTAGAISVNVSMPGATNPFTGYQRTYQGKDGVSCTFKFVQPGDGLSYLRSDKECPSFVTEDKVFHDAQKELDRMNRNSSAFTFAEYHKEEQEKRATPKCVDTASGVYIFLHAEAQNKPGWFYISKLHNGQRITSDVVGFWQKTASGAIIADFGLSKVNVNMDNVKDCNKLY